MILTKGLLTSAHNRASQAAVFDGEFTLTYQELHDRVSQLKGALRDCEIGKGDRIALLMLNDFRYLELFYAVTALGAIVVPLNVRLSIPEWTLILQDSEPKMVFISREFLPVVTILQSKVDSIRRFVLAEDRGEETGNTLPYEHLIQSHIREPLTYEGVEERDTAGLFYTGGTTGRPKGVMLSHRNLVSNAWHILLASGYDSNTHYLHAGPMFHLADGASTFAVTLVGGTHSHLRVFRPREFMQVVQRDRPNTVLLVPTMIHSLLQSLESSNYDLSSIQRILYGASPMPVEVLKKAFQMLPDVEFQQAYGMSEASPVLTTLAPKDHQVLGTDREGLLASCGKAITGVEMKIVDSERKEVPVGVVGEIAARGPNIMKGYWNMPDETDRVLQDGWYFTGDMARRDEENYYYIVDRKKDIIISGGENIYSVEVENVLYTHPDVLEAAVVGIPDQEWGERVLAVIVKREGSPLNEKKLIQFCRPSLAGYKVPKSVEFVTNLPKSGAGKILKRSLR
ncbi:long-chain acyl-CoA synthetase [Marininema mesophilum]|uniref:Long-chain acyl-CoA synthetase n=1 Tax=Marininema mesophilum TaxID=1048340 RepID=A0A1H2U5D0_9BACL|nr:long-chain-fatty-acid--CoA ligase [Marininema mesophilum]SDW51137.1 long-chain acyl-CoA synthetase [Marininema mesophilum]